MSHPQNRSLRTALGKPPVLGTWLNSGASDQAETLAAVGFDVVICDLEHGEIDPASLPDLCRAAEVRGAATLVRVPHLEPSLIGRALDAGAGGVVVPNVVTPESATAAVAACHYPPSGMRGAAPSGRGAAYGAEAFDRYRERVEREVVVVIQVEGPAGMERLHEILDVKGVDVLFVGPFDLSQHLGVPGETGHPRVVEAVRNIVERAGSRGIATGIWAPGAEAARAWIGVGVALVTISSSTLLFTAAAAELIDEVRR